MPARDRREPAGSFSMENVTVTNSAVAAGTGAKATNSVQQQQIIGAPELDDLRARLEELLASDSADSGPTVDVEAVETAVTEVDELEAELGSDRPRSEVVAGLLSRLTTTLAGITAVGDSLTRLTGALGSAFGLR